MTDGQRVSFLAYGIQRAAGQIERVLAGYHGVQDVQGSKGLEKIWKIAKRDVSHMPRLLPRLIKTLASPLADARDRPLQNPAFRQQNKTLKSSHREVPPRPSFSPAGRTRSILLDAQSPITKPWLHARHKSLPPRIRLHNRGRVGVNGRNGQGELTDAVCDRPRRMTVQERAWWANPYRAFPLPQVKSNIMSLFQFVCWRHPYAGASCR